MTNFFSGLALIMLVSVGYAAGITAVRRHGAKTPTLLDLLMVIVWWIVAFALRPIWGQGWSLFVWTCTGFVTGMGLSAYRYRRLPTKKTRSETQSGRRWRRIWSGWAHFARDMGDFQIRLFMGYFYFLLLAPFGIGASIFSDMLHQNQPKKPSNWQTCSAQEPTLDTARKQG